MTVAELETKLQSGPRPNLLRIDLYPPASGPEVALTFGTPEGERPITAVQIVGQIHHNLNTTCLAHRVRGD